MGSDPVVVVGAGPVGALLGIQLARSGADVRILEKAPAPPAESRAPGVHSRTIELFARLGLADELLSQGHRTDAMNYYSHNKRILQVDYRRLDGPYPFSLHIPQYKTQAILDGYLERLGVTVERGVEVTRLIQDGAEVTVETKGIDGRQRVLSTPFVVGCDGAHSVVRHEMNMPFEGLGYDWDWLGADVEVDWGFPENEMHIFISGAGVLACIPLGGRRWRLISPRVENGVKDRPLDLGDIAVHVEERGPRGMSIGNPTWLGVFRASRRSAPHYRQGRVFLAGDAAHIHSPAGAQGMNTGLGDAENLGWKLGLVATGRAPAALLDTYEAERAPVAQSVIALTQRIMDFFDSTHPHHPVRDVVLPRLSRTATFQRRLAPRISQLAVSYRGGPLASTPSGGRVHAGDRAPQVGGLQHGGRTTSLHDLIARPGHTVLVHGEGFTMIDPGPEVAVLRIGADVGDPSGRLRTQYGLRPGWVCAIRPDGYVGYAGPASGLQTYLSKCLLVTGRSLVEAPAG